MRLLIFVACCVLLVHAAPEPQGETAGAKLLGEWCLHSSSCFCLCTACPHDKAPGSSVSAKSHCNRY